MEEGPVGLNLNDKQAVVAEVSEQLGKAQTVVVAEYSGIQVGHLTVLRSKAREAGVYLRVLKNTLVRRAVADTPFAPLAEQMTGPLIYGLSEDPVAPTSSYKQIQFGEANVQLTFHEGETQSIDGVDCVGVEPDID